MLAKLDAIQLAVTLETAIDMERYFRFRSRNLHMYLKL